MAHRIKRDHGGEDAIEIIDLVKQFGRTRILNGCNLGIPDNMISMVLGPSGTGKSRADQAHRRPALSGLGRRARPRRVDPEHDRRRTLRGSQKFGLLFQDGALFGSMNVYDNTCFPLRQHTDKVRGRDRVRSSAAASARSGWPKAMYKMPNELSGGMRKRRLRRALVLDPAIVMFDEPDSGLDPGSHGAALRADPRDPRRRTAAATW